MRGDVLPAHAPQQLEENDTRKGLAWPLPVEDEITAFLLRHLAQERESGVLSGTR